MPQTRFIGDEITVAFEKPPMFAKKPPCPTRFVWREATFFITTNLKEWRDYGRRGRMASNMRPENLQKAAKRGSWGVGRYYFRVQVDSGRLFDLYYDRAPKGQDKRLGSWYLYREILPDDEP